MEETQEAHEPQDQGDDQRATLLEKIRQGQLVTVEGRSATTEEELDFILAAAKVAPVDIVLPEEAPTPEAEVASESVSHETTLVLTPGTAVYRPDGLLTVLIEGGSPSWCVPGDFELYIEHGMDELEGKVRELLVGAFREPAEGDPERLPGIFLTPDRLDAYRQHIELLTRDLCRQIGFDPDADQSPEQLPRGESWLAERADTDAKLIELQGMVTKAEAEATMLKDQLAAASVRIKELEAKPAAEPPSAEPTVEPEPVEPELPSAEPVVADPPKKAGK